MKINTKIIALQIKFSKISLISNSLLQLNQHVNKISLLVDISRCTKVEKQTKKYYDKAILNTSQVFNTWNVKHRID